MDPERLTLLALSEPAEVGDAEMTAHLEQCVLCRSEVETLRRTVELARETVDYRDEEPQAPEAVWLRIGQELGLGEAAGGAHPDAEPDERSAGRHHRRPDVDRPADGLGPLDPSDDVDRAARGGRHFGADPGDGSGADGGVMDWPAGDPGLTDWQAAGPRWTDGGPADGVGGRAADRGVDGPAAGGAGGRSTGGGVSGPAAEGGGGGRRTAGGVDGVLGADRFAARSGRSRWGLMAAAVAAAVAVGVVGTLVAVRPSDGGTGTPAVASSTATLAPVAGGPGGVSGRAVVREGQDGPELDVSAAGLPLQSGYYEVWVFDGGRNMVSVGVLGPGSAAALPLPPTLDLRTYHVIDISAERYDGDQTHSRDSVLRGTLTG